MLILLVQPPILHQESVSFPTRYRDAGSDQFTDGEACLEDALGFRPWHHAGVKKVNPPEEAGWEGGQSMSAEENKAVVQRVYEQIFNQGNLDQIEELISPDIVDH